MKKSSNRSGIPTKKINLLYRLLSYYLIAFMLVTGTRAQLTINPPTFPDASTVRVTLSGAQSTNAHVIFATTNLVQDVNTWTRMTTGSVGQVSFDLAKPTNANASFYVAGVAPITTPTVATPSFTPGGGAYAAPTNVVVSCATSGALIYYTTNGATPTILDNYIANGGSVYLASITTLKAKAFLYGYDDSSVASATYNINNAPFVYAGTQQVLTSGSATLQGIVSDDVLPAGGIHSTNWSKVSGPGTVTFGNSHLTNSTATFSSDGIYVLQLSAGDGQYTNNSLVTIAINPTISVSITAPLDGATYTVPTNILIQATSGGSVTQVLLYANSTLIGEATGSPLSFNWKAVTAGTLALTAVAVGTDPDNYSLSSDPVTITVNWPTNVGQVSLAQTDLEIPAAGQPIIINRSYDTRGAIGSFGPYGRLDFETIKIERNASLSSGWTGRRSGVTYWVEDTSSHLITVSLSDSEKFYFRPVAEFLNGGIYTSTINSFTIPRYQQGNRGRLSFVLVGGSQGKLEISPTPSNVGYDDYNFSGWQNLPVRVVQTGNLNDYNPSFTQFVFTGSDGTKYHFNSDGSVASKTDRNGNTLSFNSSGIFHSSGKQVTFTRDGNNFITEIYDPIAQDTSGLPALTYAYDGNGNLTNFGRLIQRSPAVYENTSYTYTNTAYPHHVTSITDPRQIVAARYVYDSSGRLSTQYDAFNRATSYFYDLTGHRQVVTDRNLNTTVQTFTDAGKVATVRDGAGGQTSFQYDEQGRKIAQVDPTGATNTFSYDSNDLLTGTTNALGSTQSATYNDFGEPLVTFDALNNGTTNEYDPAGNLINVTNALAIATSYGYDSQGNRTGETNAVGLPEQVTIISQFDSFGYLTNLSTLDAQQTLVSQVAYTYDSNGNRLTETKTRTLPDTTTETLVLQHIYDAANREIATVDPASHTNLVFYNGINKQSQTVDALGRTNSYFYDANGQLTNTVFADGLSEQATYDAEGRQMTKTDRGGRVTQFTYDAVGRPLKTIFPDLGYSENTYDASGRLKSTTLNPVPQGFSPPPSGLTTSYIYDVAGRRTGVVDALNQTNSFAYDANGNQTNLVDALAHTNAFVFDALNRRTQIIYPDNTTESAAYDGLNRKIAVTNQAQVVAIYAFDTLGRLTAVTNAFGTTQQMATTYLYDEVGNLRKQIDALNHTNLFEYNSLGQRTKEILPGNQTASFGYDAVGNLIRQTNFNLVVITNQYDALNRLTNKSSVGGYNISYAYSPTSQRTNMADASGTNSYTYDSRDRLLTKITPQGTLTYVYDLFGNLALIQSSTANGTQLTYHYDVLNRLTNVVDRFANNTFYSFDGAGNLKSYRNQNNITNVYSYSSLNRLTNISVTSVSGTIASFAYKLAPAGNRTNLTENVNGTSRTSQWFYDPLYRLTNEVMSGASPTGTVSYKYDAVGNRTNRASTVSGVTNQNFAYNGNDQLSTDVYDANGNTRTNGNNTFSYDVANRLISATVDGTNITIVYDGDGNRVKKTVGTSTNYFLVDDRNPSGFVQVLEDLTSIGSTPARLYSYGLDLISQRQSDGTTSFYGYDGNGNVRFLTAANGTISDTYTYDAFGILIASTGTTPNQYRYTGEQYDPNLGFYFLRDRYMAPDTDRFLSRDSFNASIYDPPALHKYTYAQNDPVRNVDPSGKNPTFAILLLVVFVIAVIAALVFHFSRTGKVVEASTIVNRLPNPEEDGWISGALENLKRSGAFPNTQLDDIHIQVADAYQHVGVAGSVTLLNSSTLTVSGKYLHANTLHELTVALGAEAEHAISPLGLGMQSEAVAEKHFHEVFLPALHKQLGWNVDQFKDWHHGGQGGL